MTPDDKRHPREIWLHATCDRCKWTPDWTLDPHECLYEGCHQQPVRYIRADIVSVSFPGAEGEKWSERLDSNQRPLSPQKSADG